MIEHAVSTPTIPIPFHRLLKVVALGFGKHPQAGELLQRLEAEKFEVEVSDDYDRDVSEDASVGAYVVAADGDRLEPARKLGKAVRSIGFRTPLWALADSHRISDIAVLGSTGEVDGYIYLGQQSPAFYAKQVVASIVDYGMSLLPPFFGGMMAYDSEANVSFACPGHQGGQFFRKSPAGQLFFKHFGEQIFRNDLCNADVDLGDLLIHVGRRGRRAAPCREGLRRRPHLLRAEWHDHGQQGRCQCRAAPRRPGAVRPQQPQVAAPGSAGPGRSDPDLPADRAQSFRHDRRRSTGTPGTKASLRKRIRTHPMVKDPERHKSGRPFRLACIQLATYDGTVYNVDKVLEKIGHLCDYVLWDEAWIGYNAFHPLFTDHSPMRIEKLGPESAGLFSTQSVHKQGAGFSQASQIHKRDEHSEGTEALHRAQALQRIVPDECLDVALLSAVRRAGREREGPRRQGRRNAVGPLHRARHRGAQEAA